MTKEKRRRKNPLHLSSPRKRGSRKRKEVLAYQSTIKSYGFSHARYGHAIKKIIDKNFLIAERE